VTARITHDGLIREAAARLEAAGLDEPRHNALMLMLHALGGSRAGLIAIGAEPVPDPVAAAFEAMLSRRLAREPLQHILGTTGFYGLDIRTDARALIPRADSECVVEAALDRLPEDARLSLADLGTGSGCLLAALLVNRKQASGVGVEASPAAASLAQENFAALGLSARASLFEGSWAGWTGWAGADLIISNPPYIASAEIEALAPEVRRHDPLSALDGGADGLSAYREIIRMAATGMKPGAWLVLEIGYTQRAALLELLGASGFENLASGKDLGRNDRWVAAQKS